MIRLGLISILLAGCAIADYDVIRQNVDKNLYRFSINTKLSPQEFTDCINMLGNRKGAIWTIWLQPTTYIDGRSVIYPAQKMGLYAIIMDDKGNVEFYDNLGKLNRMPEVYIETMNLYQKFCG